MGSRVLEQGAVADGVDVGGLDRFAEAFRRKRALFMPGHAADWPAVRQWSFEALAELAGEQEVTIEVGDILLGETRFRRTGLRDYIERLIDGDAVRGEHGIEYLSLFDFFGAFPGLIADVDFSPLTRRAVWHTTLGWLGPSGTVTSFHIDWIDNLLVQIRGRKRVTLVDPADSRCMYPSRKFDYRTTASRVDPERPEDWPDFARATTRTVEIGPGDALFIPRGWWHRVVGLQAGLSVNTFAHDLRGLLTHQVRASALRWMHDRGLYRTGDCTCHRRVDGRRAARIHWD